MTARELTRGHLEALLVGQAVLDLRVTVELIARVDPLCISPACRTLLADLADRGLEATIETPAQRELSDRVNALTLGQLRGLEAYSIDTLVGLVNRLPHVRRPRASALDVGASEAA